MAVLITGLMLTKEQMIAAFIGLEGGMELEETVREEADSSMDATKATLTCFTTGLSSPLPQIFGILCNKARSVLFLCRARGSDTTLSHTGSSTFRYASCSA